MQSAVPVETAKDAGFIGTSVKNLRTVDLVPGTELELGDATVTLIVGWREWLESGPNSAERRNVVSIVARLEYMGSSILFTGDTIGKRLTDDDMACKDAEKAMVDNASAIPLSSESQAHS